MIDKVYSARAAAPLLGTTERTIRRWQATGKLEGEHVGREIRIRHSAIAKRAAELGIALSTPNGQVDPSTGELLPPIAPQEAAQAAASSVVIQEHPLALAVERPAPSGDWIERAVRAETRLELLYQLARHEHWAAMRSVLEA